MSTQSFHCFANLPYELRRKIWQMAIRPANSGVHHFSIFNSANDNHSPSAKFAILDNDQHSNCEYKAAAPRAACTQTVYSWTQGNPSSYLWDTGLWTACKESREVIMAHLNMRYWNEMRREFQQRYYLWNFYPDGEEHKDKPAMAIARHNGEELHLMVNPQRDLFFLDSRDFGFTVDWDTLFCDLPFSCVYRGYGPLNHIAVEFDPSWNVGLRQDIDENWDPEASLRVYLDDLLEEGTPRGLITRAVRDCAISAFHKKEYPFFWLVDRGMRRKTPSQCNPKFLPDEFSDCNHKYIETTLEDMDYDTFEEYFRTADHFVDQLGVLADGELSNNISYYLGWGFTDQAEGFSFVVQQCLGVLTCS